MGVSEATYYNWNAAADRKKYAGLGVPELRKLRILKEGRLAEENQKLKQLVAEWPATAAKLGQAYVAGCAQKSSNKAAWRAGPESGAGRKLNKELPGCCHACLFSMCLQHSCCREAVAVL